MAKNTLEQAIKLNEKSPLEKSRQDRLVEIKSLLDNIEPRVQREHIPFVTSVSPLDSNGKLTLIIDFVALMDALHISSTGKSKVAFNMVQLVPGVRANINIISVLEK